AQSHGWLFVVADGVGGQDLGEIASRTAVDSVLANFRNSAGGESHTSLLRRLVQAANHAVYEAGHSSGPGGTPMSTTVVCCALRYDRATIAHVGDSRCYLIRQGRTTQLTRDHTSSPNSHTLNRSVGAELFVNVDINEFQVMPGDALALCSDGLHNSVSGA